jgi:predicted Zn-ribbon and HTH transcriptional regulator
LRLLSSDDHSAEVDIPSHCESCGTGALIYDHERGEVVCQGCGTVLNLGVQKEDAAYLLRRPGLAPRRLILQWCQRTAMAKADHAVVDAKHGPEILRLEDQILKLPGRACKRCGTRIERQGRRGRYPEYCKPCRKIVDIEFVKRSMGKNPDKYRRIKKRLRKQTPQPSDHELGSRPLGRREIRGLGLRLIPSDVGRADSENGES